jgi:hypothetical protein
LARRRKGDTILATICPLLVGLHPDLNLMAAEVEEGRNRSASYRYKTMLFGRDKLATSSLS